MLYVSRIAALLIVPNIS